MVLTCPYTQIFFKPIMINHQPNFNATAKQEKKPQYYGQHPGQHLQRLCQIPDIWKLQSPERIPPPPVWTRRGRRGTPSRRRLKTQLPLRLLAGWTSHHIVGQHWIDATGSSSRHHRHEEWTLCRLGS
jgi:hypothetical protein